MHVRMKPFLLLSICTLGIFEDRELCRCNDSKALQEVCHVSATSSGWNASRELQATDSGGVGARVRRTRILYDERGGGVRQLQPRVVCWVHRSVVVVPRQSRRHGGGHDFQLQRTGALRETDSCILSPSC